MKRLLSHQEHPAATEASNVRAEPNQAQKRSMTKLSSIKEPDTLTPPDPTNVSEEDVDTSVDETSIQPYVGEAACTTFGLKLRQFLFGEETPPAPHRPRYYKNQRMLRASCTDCQLPNRSDAQLLVRVVLRFIGPDYHLLRRTSFLDRLEETYKLEVLNVGMKKHLLIQRFSAKEDRAQAYFSFCRNGLAAIAYSCHLGPYLAFQAVYCVCPRGDLHRALY